MISPAHQVDNNVLMMAMAVASLRHYLNVVTVDSLPEPRAFGDLAEPWQWQRQFNHLIPAFEWLVKSEEERSKIRPYDGPHGFWFTRARGHDKTSSIARLVNYCLFAGRRKLPLRISVAAADKKQAKLVRDAMTREAALNPWFGRKIEFNNYDASGPGGELQILAADAGGAYGAGDDLIICDELTHWPKPDLWTAIYSGSVKRIHCVIVVITNAGYYGTWQRTVMDELATKKSWLIDDQPGRLAGWMSEDRVQEAREVIIAESGTPFEALRLMDNHWVHSQMGAVFDPADVYAMATDDPIFTLSI